MCLCAIFFFFGGGKGSLKGWIDDIILFYFIFGSSYF